jgi:porphobilinogen deaminase
VVLSLDGSRRWWASAERPLEEAAALGTDVAQQMLRQGATEVLTLP